MKSMKNIIWGIFFILIAAFVIVGSMGYFGDISVWTIVFAGFLAIWFVGGLLRLSWGNMLFPLAFAAILFDKELGIEHLTPWPVLAAALFGTIGLSLIFKKKNHHSCFIGHDNWEANRENFKNGHQTVDEMNVNDTTFESEVVFSTSVRYITSQNLKYGSIESVFSNTTIYMDNANLCEGHAAIKVESVFGKTTLYVPKEWNVDMKLSKVFGGANERGVCMSNGENHLVIQGEMVFGNLEIVYV